jgi:hypothetical protein
MADAIKNYLKDKNYTRKFRPVTGKEYILVFGGAENMEVTGQDNKPEEALKILVREKNQTEVFSFITRSMSLLDQLADIERGDVFSLKKQSKVIAGQVRIIYDAAIVEKHQATSLDKK